VPRAGQLKARAGERFPDRIAIGLLVTFPPELVDRVAAEMRRVQQRSWLLPARVVYYVLACATRRELFEWRRETTTVGPSQRPD
jgi:Insertion element 4 transposase N-terminal